MVDAVLDNMPLGKQVAYDSQYNSLLLYPISRLTSREKMGIKDALPFNGTDIWNAYELSWLDESTRKPRIAMAEFYFPCNSTFLIESKSFKLYLNSLNQTPFKNEAQLKATLQNDLSQAAGSQVKVNLILPPFKLTHPMQEFSGFYLDDLPVSIDNFLPKADLLITSDEVVAEDVYSNLLKTNCPVTQQPDWASISIQYEGKKINHASLLKYIVSYRQHTDFHEQCVEQIFMDIMQYCAPEKLSVYARYTRRGGLDINPFRSNFQSTPINIRSYRQ